MTQLGQWLVHGGCLPCMGAVLFLALCAWPIPQAHAGQITFEPHRPADSPPVTHAWLIRRDAADFGTTLPVSVKPDVKGVIYIDHLSPGVYDLKFQTANGLVMGWDAHVPASDYEIEQPLSQASRKVLLKKLAQGGAAGFDDHVAVLDIQGNIQNAAILTRQLRTRPFSGGHYKQGEWVFRATRWRWESPQETTWAPYQEQPFYALLRLRLMKKSYEALNITFARHLGGIHLTIQDSHVNLGKVLIPKVQPGLVAVNPDGSVIKPIIIKPAATPATSDDQAGTQKGS